jgi:putative ABC transport system substrate-binding protein
VFGPFLLALRARGYRENDNLELEYRSANGQMRRLDALAAELAFAHRLPMMADWKETAQAGALIAYGPNLAALAARAAVFVDRILRGARPADLPVEQPNQFDLIVNLRTARQLGITLPGSVLLRADATIE